MTPRSIDRGFQGVLVRHHFKGMPKQHGVTKSHRRPGYIGFGGTRVKRGKKLPGHEGMEFRTLRGVEVGGWGLRLTSLFLFVQFRIRF